MNDVMKAPGVRAGLAEAGEQRLGWIRSRMRSLAAIRTEFAESRPFDGLTIGVALHSEPKTAVLLETLAAGGAHVVGTGNHGSTQDDIVAALERNGIELFGHRDETLDEHRRNLERTIDRKPDILLDNGADLAAIVADRGLADTIVGGTEETTSGGFRLREEYAGRIPFPVIVINDSPLKAIAENRHAVGQSAVESFMRITNLQVPGRRFAVAGYGWCGRGVAQYLRALGGKVAVVEVDELKAFEAAFDGYRVGSLGELAGWADVVITATGRPGVVTEKVFDLFEDGVVLANIGHFPWEIDVPALRSHAVRSTTVATAIEELELPSGRRVVLLADGRMYNLAGTAPKGNSIESMDLGFTLQARSLERVATGTDSLVAGPQRVPDDIERAVARQTLALLNSAD
ncbi:adenosylhomocysteinase [Leifsonia poae]|uniref:adenosylhomocysteinase n=1 Tax=Leifsonia poae TaxID=110933 RepID=UPI001CBC536E|nr:adenosylhomocysteinase [Leifsonia poae]